MATEVAAAYVELGARITGLERGLKNASRQVDAFGATADKNAAHVGARFQALGSRMSSVGRKMTLGLTLPIVGIGAAAFKMAASFERSMSKITGLVGISRTEVAGMRKSVLDLSKGTGKSADDLANGLFVITSAGLRGSDAMDALTRAGKASAAGLGEVNDIGRAVAGAMNAYGSTTLNAARATDIITATARAGNFETSQLAGALGRVLPFAKQAGASLEQVGGSVALLTRTNGNAAESITQMTALFRAFVVPTQEGKKILDQIGTSAGEVRQQIGKEGLVSALESLDKGLGGNREQLGRLLGSSEAAGAAFQILDANAATISDTFGTVSDSVGMTDDAFAAAAETAQFKMQAAMTKMQSALIELGGIIAPVISKIATGISGVVAAFTSLPGPVKSASAAAAALVAALGPLLWMGGKVVASIGAIKIAMAGLGAASAGTAAMGTAAGGAAGKMGMLAGAIPLVANPIGLLAVAAGVGVAGLLMFGKRTDMAAASSNNLATAARNVTTAFTATNQAVSGQAALNQQVAASSTAVIAAKNGERVAVDAFLAAHANGRAANESEAAFQMRLVQLYKQVTSARMESTKAQNTSTEAVRESVDNVTKLGEASNKEIDAARKRVETTGAQAQMDKTFAAGSAQAAKSMAANKEAVAALAVAESRRGDRLKQVEKAQVAAREAVKSSSLTDSEKAASLDIVNRAIAKTRGEIKSLPESKTTTIKAKNDATATIETVKAGLSNIDRFITVTIRAIKENFQFGGLVQRLAGGGTVRGPGGVDRVPAMLTAGEVVLTKRQQALVNGGMNIRDAIRNTGGAFAKGGTVGGQVTAARGIENRRKAQLDAATKGKDKNKIAEARKAYNAAKTARERLEKDAASLRSFADRAGTAYIAMGLADFDQKASANLKKIEQTFVGTGEVAGKSFAQLDSDLAANLKSIEQNFKGTGAVAGHTFKSLGKEMKAAQKQLNATFDALTPAEAQMKALQDAGSQEELTGNLGSAQADLAEAQKWGDPKAIAAAQKSMREAERAMALAELTKTAEAERAQQETARESAQEILDAEYEAKRALMQEQLDAQLETERGAGASRQALLQQQLDERLAAQQATDAMERVAREHNLQDEASKMAARTNLLRGNIKNVIARMTSFAKRLEVKGKDIGEALSQGLVAAGTVVKTKAAGLAKIIAKYLETNSPTKLGPMSNLDEWWGGMVPALLAGLDESALGSGLSDAAALEASLALGGSRTRAGAGGGRAMTINLNVSDQTFAGMSREQADRVARDIKAALDRQVTFAL